jgi:hypothetical protein
MMMCWSFMTAVTGLGWKQAFGLVVQAVTPRQHQAVSNTMFSPVMELLLLTLMVSLRFLWLVAVGLGENQELTVQAVAEEPEVFSINLLR